MRFLLALVASPLMYVALWLQMRGQKLMTASEVLRLFDGMPPQEVFDLFRKLPTSATREQLIQALREIANRNAMGATFASRT